MDEEDHEEIFGKDIKEDIYKAIRSKGGETKVHPAQKLMDEAAMGDPDAKEELYRGVSGEDRHDLEDSILDRSSKLVSSIFTPPEILSKMERSIAKDLEKENLEEGGNWSQRGTAHDLYLKMASNESLSLESLENIYDFKSTYVREKIISNPSMPLESAIKKIELASDEPRRISMEFFETTKPNDPKIIIPKARMLRALSLRDDAPLDYILDSLYKLPKVVGYNDIPEDNKPGTMQDKLDTYINLIHKAKSSDELMKIYESIKHNASSDVPVSKIIHRFVDNKQCPPEILDEIISIFSEGDFLRFLRKTNSSGKEEIKAVAQHPNTNIGMLNKLEDLIAPPGYKGWEDGNIDHVNARRDLAKKLLLNKNITQEFVNDLYSRLYRDPKIALYDRQKIISTAEIIPREMLDELAASSSFEVKKNLAENKSTTPEILNDLFEETKVPGDRRIANQIRNKIANNPSISPELANKIFDDYLAARESTDTFQALRNRFTPAWNVSPVHLSKNPAIKEDLMMRIADNEIVREEAPNVLGFLVNNPSATPNVIAKIASLNISKDIKLSIAANKKTPVSILQNLAENPERPIRWAAQKTLRDLSANKNELTYEEGQVSDTKLASLIKWLINSGFKKEADEIDLLLKEAAKKKKKKSKKKKDRTPTKPELWSASKAWAKRKYDVWPSAYAVGAALKRYKEKGGGWRGPKPKK